jgi:trans-aconitate methyltransferase
MPTSTTSKHYESHSSKTYEQAYFYEPGAYQQYLVDLVRKRLALVGDNWVSSETKHILDIGGGTGNFAQALVRGLPNVQVTVVDPYLDPTLSLDQFSLRQISFVQASAESFAQAHRTVHHTTKTASWRCKVDRILLKEVVHHLEDRVGMFRGMYSDLSMSGSLLIITRPQINVDYPLWDAAREVWKQNQPSAQELVDELQQGGFVSITETLETYPCSIPLARWQEMVRGRFWSTFSNFSDQELEEACIQMETEHVDRINSDGVLHFEDRLILLVAQKD